MSTNRASYVTAMVEWTCPCSQTNWEPLGSRVGRCDDCQKLIRIRQTDEERQHARTVRKLRRALEDARHALLMEWQLLYQEDKASKQAEFLRDYIEKCNRALATTNPDPSEIIHIRSAT